MNSPKKTPMRPRGGKKQQKVVEKKSLVPNPYNLSIDISGKGHLLRPESLIVAEENIERLMNSFIYTYSMKQVEGKYKEYCCAAVLQESIKILQLRGIPHS